MKLKYILTSEIDNQEKKVIETNFVNFIEKEEGKYVIFEFIDEKNMKCNLKISDDEVEISYAKQSFFMKKNQFINNKLIISETDFFDIQVYLIKVIISKELVSFTYDLLQNKSIIVRNTISLIFQNN
ncbi:hypothetical protein [Metamycoplasma canadense]|uniref:Uncharacterized protein n=1 Tax=Metamycoplasma canadense TaxID=29554 RepID=A0A077L558_9BACT|nr:hypothetical protein [Metamycoplasma canadense]BAP39420.1 hypothetical protein MCAN360_0169 [Metamycoplasma canadense]